MADLETRTMNIISLPALLVFLLAAAEPAVFLLLVRRWLRKEERKTLV